MKTAANCFMRNSRKNIIFLSPVLICFIFTTCSFNRVSTRDPVLLITDMEAEQPDYIQMRGKKSIDKEDGPVLKVKSPEVGFPLRKPINVEVVFIPKDAPVDLESLKVTYMKFVKIDLTDRIRPYATEKGIFVKNADIPSGKHTLRIVLADTQKRETVRTLKIEIK